MHKLTELKEQGQGSTESRGSKLFFWTLLNMETID